VSAESIVPSKNKQDPKIRYAVKAVPVPESKKMIKCLHARGTDLNLCSQKFSSEENMMLHVRKDHIGEQNKKSLNGFFLLFCYFSSS